MEARALLTFLAPVDYAVGERPSSVVAADLTNNGIDDLVTANNPYSTVSVLLGNGDGTFQPARTLVTGTNPSSVAVGDLTGNGKVDIVTGNHGYLASSPSVSVLLGNGDGTFHAPRTFALNGLNNDDVSVAVADMNHDGRLDLVVTGDASTSPTHGVLEVFLGHGDGTFSLASTTQLSGAVPESVKLADLNGDGKLDVAAAVSETNPGVAVLLGTGDGTLQTPTYFATGGSPISLAAGDVNGDGKLDLVAANYGAGYGISAGSVSVLMGNGDGSFQPAANIALPSVSKSGSPITAQLPRAVVMGDLNADGKMDLAVAGNYQYSVPGSYYGGPVSLYTATQPVVTVLLGKGDGTFTISQSVRLDHSTPYALTAGNFNGHALPDLAVADPNTNIVSVLVNAANLSSTPPQAASFAVSGFPASTTAGTPGSFNVTALNLDGTVDTGYTGAVSFSSSDGQAALPATYIFTAADAGEHAFSATLKTAGTQSIAATDTTTGTLKGSETEITVAPTAASHLAVSAQATSTAGNSFTVTVTALDPYDNTATGYAGTVHFSSSDGQAGLPADYAFTTGDAGVHTFTSAVTLKTAGSQTVTATDASVASIAGSAAVTVSPAAASTMIVSGFPSPITAGVAGNFVVTLKDAYGNVATGYTGTVHLTSSDAKAVLPANFTFTAADAGKHTFSATLKTAGTQTITATDTANANLSGSDSGITVKAAAASKFVLTAPSSVMPGQAFSLTVTVEDAYGNLVTGYTGSIQFSSSDNKAILPANYTFTAGDNGVHTFTGLVLRKAGYQTITVTDTHNSAITGKKVVDVV